VLTLCRPTGDRTNEASALTILGLVHQRQGHHEPATDHLEHALTLYQQINAQGGRANVLNGLGETMQAAGAVQEALTRHTDALLAATKAGDRYEQARAHDGIAAAHHTTGNVDLAHQHWQHALTLYASLEVPEAQTVQAELAALGRNTAVATSNRC
jgi:tetratricopeptide (TPR) repeat protein